MPNPYMGSGETVEAAKARRDERRGHPQRATRARPSEPAAPAPAKPSGDDKAAKLRAKADERVAGTVADVVAWVGKSAPKAAAALAAEQAGAQRVSLIRKLEAVAG